ncbi:MAG: DUF1704 domain-containing protein, partial [Myxococcales bacterium]|nr:DUF1704 domain-containing protein [Myxococcales bacterium]
AMHAGASFEELSRLLVDGHGFSAHEAVILAERAYRGGGAARDCVYLGGWQRVREAIAGGQIVLEDLWLGKVGIADAPSCRRLRDAGYIRPLVYRPSLERSLRATDSGTSCETSPPSLATSLTMFEAT